MINHALLISQWFVDSSYADLAARMCFKLDHMRTKFVFDGPATGLLGARPLVSLVLIIFNWEPIDFFIIMKSY